MKNLYYCFNQQNFNDNHKELIDLYLEEATPSSEWYRSVPFFLDGAKNISEYFRNIKNQIFQNPDESWKLNRLPTTVRTCPGIRNYLNTSYIIKSPCDIHISIENDFIIANTPPHGESDCLLSFSFHNANQYKTLDNNLFGNRSNLKFLFPLTIGTDAPYYMYQQPYYHSDLPFEITPGLVEGEHTKSMELNLIVMLREGKYDFMIKSGTPLAYIWFPEKVKLKHREYQPLSVRKKFIRGLTDV